MTRFFLLTSFIMLLGCTGSMNSNYEDLATYFGNQDLPLNQLKRYHISDFGDPATMVELSPTDLTGRGEGAGNIWVFKSADNLVIFIETNDRGHAGEFGYAYSQNGTVPVWDHDNWGELWTIDEQITDHWWKISFRLG